MSDSGAYATQPECGWFEYKKEFTSEGNPLETDTFR